MQTPSVNQLEESGEPSARWPAAGPFRTRLVALLVLAVCFGYVEAALVADLRLFLDPDGNRFPLLELPDRIQPFEQLRELTTLLLLWAAAALVTSDAAARFALFLLSFGTWDLVYYLGLRWILDWPPALQSWDLLFLVPVPWLAPVYAPTLVSLVLIVVGSLTIRHVQRYGSFRVGRRHVLGASIGGTLILISFLQHARAPAIGRLPERYAIELLVLGLAVGIVAYIDVYRRNRLLASKAGADVGSPGAIAET